MKKCYYEILEISIESTEKEIQNAFRKQVKKWHPDISKEANAENIIKEINEAYDILSNKEKRYFYNKERGYIKKSPLKVQNHFVIKIKHIYMIATLLIIISFSLGGIIFFFKESNFLKDKKNNSTEIMDKEFGDKVKYWFTFNEIWAVATNTYIEGTFPNGEKYNMTKAFQIMHNMMLAHAKAVVAYKNSHFPHVLLEASGNITKENMIEYAKTGVDAISSGSLIHQAVWLDFSMRITHKTLI